MEGKNPIILDSCRGCSSQLMGPVAVQLSTYANFLQCCFYILLGAWLFAANAVAQEAPSILFDRLNTKQGMSHPASLTILHDHNGFIWIGTQQGLNRYDGTKMEVYNFFPDDPSGLSNGYVYDLLENADGDLLVATDGGLDIYQPATRTFKHVPTDPSGKTGLPHKSVRRLFQSSDGTIWIGTRRGLSRWNGENEFVHVIAYPPDPQNVTRPGVRAIAEDSLGRLWIGTQENGLKLLDPATGIIQDFEYRKGVENSTGDRYIRTITIDHLGNVWVGSQNGGVAVVNPESLKITLHQNNNQYGNISSNSVMNIYEDKRNRIWIGTDGGGLNLWDEETKSFTVYRHDPANPFSIGDDLVYDMVEDDGGVMWVGTFNGISKWNTEVPIFTHIRRHESGENTLSNNKISTFFQASDDTIWVGTIGGGANVWTRESNSFDVISSSALDTENSLSSNLVMSLLEYDNQNLWIGTMDRGITVVKKDGQVVSKHEHDEFDERSVSSNRVSDIKTDSKGRLWISTFGAGINQYMPDGTFQRYPRKSGPDFQFPSFFIVAMEPSANGTIWLASAGGGLINFDPDTEKVEFHQHDTSNSNSISGNQVISVKEIGDAVWVGTRDTGLNMFKDNQWYRFNRREGIASSAIYGILGDEYGRVWASHSNGISVYDARSNRFTNYDPTHGLQGEDFNNGAFLKLRSGELMFGGTNGFNIFDPKEIRGNLYTPPVKLTRFTKFNKEFSLGLPAHEVTEIQLDYTDYVIGFEFAALDYTAPEKNQYRYKLSGFETDWVDARNVHQATYTNLDPGNYRFRVQGSNNDGVWNSEGLSIDLFVAPPWWATWWAYLLYSIATVFILYGFSRVYKARLHRAEQLRYSQQLEGLVTARTQELEKEILGHKAARSKLSSSLEEKEVLLKEVHHRVKNNMQVISSLLNIQADSVDDERFQSLLIESQQRIKSMALIHENLYRSDDLLEINFNTYVEMLANGLLRFYRFDNLVVSLKQDVKNVFLDIDTAVPCGLIINELVSNSLKHAYKGRTGSGVITINFHPIDNGKRYRFSVADDGIGVADDFDIENTPSMGLEIVRILTQQLDGTLSVNNQEGTEFVIEFPGG